MWTFLKRGEEESHAAAREKMVVEQLAARGIRDPRVLAAMRAVPRHEFVPEKARAQAYADHPLDIGHRQTISQPFVVALMTELARLGPESRVLEIGAGCGYQTAVLAEIARAIYSIEYVAPLVERAAQTLAGLGYKNIQVRAGDGFRGWPEYAPFDAIVITASPLHVPEPLLEQLKIDGRLVTPEGATEQMLRVYTRTSDGFTIEDVLPVRFVPMVGEAERN